MSAQEWELLSFFEVEPEFLDDAPWEFAQVQYTVQQGKIKLIFEIRPRELDVRITLFSGAARIYELSAKGIHDVSYEKASGKETLHICLDRFNTMEMAIRIKPQLLIEQVVRRYRASR